ncbi:MAG: S41 family peptidase [Bacteroidota bacterium]
MPQIENTTNKKLNIWMPFLLALMLSVGMYVGTKLAPKQVQQEVVFQTDEGDLIEYKKVGNGRIEELIRFIEARYVDEVDSEELIEKAISKILEELDPHSNYIPAEQLARVNDELEGNFDGVGIEFIILDDTIVVVAPLSGGPAEEVGIMAGDKIVEINDTTAVGSEEVNVRDLVNKLKGIKGTEVKIGVLRGKEKSVRSFDVRRAEIPIYSVDVGYMIDAKTGFIKVNRFSATTYREFMKEVERLKEKGMQDLVIDLRQNPGGYLQEATKMLSQMFPDKGKLLVYTEGRTVRRNDYQTSGLNHFPIDKVAVLIDEGSASASEIVAGAVQDWDRGVIVGRRSFGKGLVQEQYDLKDGSALRLTVARYYTPSNRLIQKSYEDKFAYDHDVLARFEGGELVNKDSIHQTDTTRFYTKLENRVVYGGGGITPDIFIPLDTSFMDKDYLKMSEIAPQFIYRYVENHDEELDEISLRELRDEFVVDQAMLTAFYEYAAENNVEIAPSSLQDIEYNVKLLLKSRLGKHLFKEKGFYSIWNDADEVVKAAVRALKKENPLADSEKN